MSQSNVTELIKESLIALMKTMVDHPDDLSVNMTEASTAVIIEVTPHRQDVGAIIGKGGKIAKAFRVILAAIGGNQKKHIEFNVIEPA